MWPCNSSSGKRTVASAPFTDKDGAALASPPAVQERPRSPLRCVPVGQAFREPPSLGEGHCVARGLGEEPGRLPLPTSCSVACVCAQSLSRVRLFVTRLDCSPPGSSVRGIVQARILEWVAISFSRGSSRPKDRTHVSCVSCSGKWVLYHCATWEACSMAHGEQRASLVWSPLTSQQGTFIAAWCTWKEAE